MFCSIHDFTFLITDTKNWLCGSHWQAWLILKKLLVLINIRKRWLTRKGNRERKILHKERTKLVPRIIRKSSEIDAFVYSHQNDAVKKELAQLSDIFKVIKDINQKMIELDGNYTEELRYPDIDETVFSFKHRVHNWLKERDKISLFAKK